MNYHNYITWLKQNLPIDSSNLHITETSNTFLISRLTGIEENPEPITFISANLVGNFVSTRIFLDRQQDQQLVSNLPKEYKQQLKAQFGAIRFDFIVDDVNEKSKTIFDNSPDEAINFFTEYANQMTWQLPLKSKKKLA